MRTYSAHSLSDVYKELTFLFLHSNQMDGQDSQLNSFRAQELIQQAASTSQATSQTNSILLDDSTPQTNDPTLKNLPHRPKNQGLPQDEPPPYAPTDPSSSNSQYVPTPPQSEAGPSTAPQPQSSGFSFGKTLKAFAQSFMPKPDPFVNALCQAVTNGDIQQITGLLSQGINIDGRGEEGNTPLQCAIIANQEEAADVLLSAGANYTSSGGWGPSMPPMFQAAAAGRIGIAKLIMNKGVKATEESMVGQPYFVDVVSSNNLEGVRFLLDYGAKPNSANISGRPVIIQAVKQGNVELVNLLIKFGAKVNASDITGSGILAVASEKDDLRMVQTLLDHGAKPDGTTVYGVTVLVDAITRRRLDLARLLLDNGAKGKKDDVSGQPIILFVIKDSKIKAEDKVDLVRRLLENGANPNAKDSTWDTPALCFALDSGIPELVELLLEHGAKTKAKTSSGEPVLIYAVDKGKMAEARMLLEHGADANGANKQGKTPLMQAVIKQDLELIKLLMEHGADVNAVGSVSIASFAGALRRPDILDLLGLGGASGEAAPPEYQASTKS